MATTQSYYVSTADNKIRQVNCNPREFFTGSKKGQAKYIIEVFGYNHRVYAEKMKKMIQKMNLENEITTIRIDTR